MNKKLKFLLVLISLFAFFQINAYAMHIMEGFLPPVWSISWGAVCVPLVIIGLYSIKRKISDNPKLKMLLAMAGAFVFVLSALKLPSVTGSCSHPTGVGLGSILFGPFAMSVIGVIVLLFQSLLLAHGGLTTLGANTFSMAIAGPFVAFAVYKIVKKLNGADWLAVFSAAALGDLFTYIVTAFQLSLAFPSPEGGFMFSLAKFLGIFAVTQIPLAISEGILTVLIFNALKENSRNELISLNILKGGAQ